MTESRESERSGAKPPTTARSRENSLVSKAMRLAEQQIEDGTVSAQVLSHFLKVGTEREKLEREKLQHEIAYIKAKSSAQDSSEAAKERYEKAINAMRAYQGVDEYEAEDFD